MSLTQQSYHAGWCDGVAAAKAVPPSHYDRVLDRARQDDTPYDEGWEDGFRTTLTKLSYDSMAVDHISADYYIGRAATIADFLRTVR
jgi:hypothetical protein